MTPAETTSILTWWLAGGLFVAGLVLGAVIYAVVSRRLPQGDTRSHTTEQQLNNYRAAVLKHFDETSALVQQLGTDYQNLVEKISQNMHELGTSADGKPLMPPIFPAIKPAIKNHGHTVMPKTYVDPKDQHKD
jgi:uncharacterized membrane-anchored protein YhcB (DUF1043 family)